jgi:Tol biopolymer transport system component
MRKRFIFTPVALAALTIGCRFSASTPPAVDVTAPAASACSGSAVASVTPLVDPGGNVDWSPGSAWIAYDAPDDKNWTDTWLMKPDGSAKKCLTCDNSAEPTPLHLGNPTWHSSLDWIVVQGVEETFYDRFPSADEDYKQRIMDVGVGIGNELWAMSSDGARFVKLTDVWGESRFSGGVLHPHFSHDGRLLAWTQRVGNIPGDPGGEWAIKIADFVVEGGTPRLENIRTYQPGSETHRLYEVHSFSPDDSLLLYSSNSDGQTQVGYDIYSLNVADGQATRLTFTEQEWDEHAHYSPDGKCIVWMSTMNAGSERGLLKTELWIMSADGSGQTQLTFFNDPDSFMYSDDSYGVVPADLSWSPIGTQFALLVIVNQSQQTEYSMPGRTVLVTLK